MKNESMYFKYTFHFDNGRTHSFFVNLDEKLNIKPTTRGEFPDWTKLGRCKCDVCPLKEEERPHCPAAVNLIDVIEFFKNQVSTREVDMTIEVPTRTYKKERVPISQGVSGIIGVLMASSGCPIVGRLKPMVGTHMPFASLKETTYRILSMYLLGQYFSARRGEAPDWELKELVALFDDIRKVNKSFCRRLHLVCREDANLNAVVRLDCFTDSTSFLIQEKGLDEIEATFDSFLQAKPISRGTS